MKWVYIGLVQAVGFGILGAFLDEDTWPPVLGVSLASVILWLQYHHAIQAGLSNHAPGTED